MPNTHPLIHWSDKDHPRIDIYRREAHEQYRRPTSRPYIPIWIEDTSLICRDEWQCPLLFP